MYLSSAEISQLNTDEDSFDCEHENDRLEMSAMDDCHLDEFNFPN